MKVCFVCFERCFWILENQRLAEDFHRQLDRFPVLHGSNSVAHLGSEAHEVLELSHLVVEGFALS